MDEPAFADLTERYRRELHVHCYRMLGSYDEAEDLLQETLLRAWRGRAGFEGRSSARVWLHRIATNACLDFLKHSARRPVPVQEAPFELAEVPWLQPYPDVLLDEVAAPASETPEAVVFARETIELVFIAALQLLPPRQRAVLILCDLLGWSAEQTASMIESTATAVNSSLQRARATLQQHRPNRLEWSRPASLSEDDRGLLRRYMAAHERGDTEAVLALLRDDLRISMPPDPRSWNSREDYADFALKPERPGQWRVRPSNANRQPTVAFFLRRWSDTEYRATALQVLRIENGLIAEIVAFRDPNLFAAFGLPPVLP